MFTQDIINRFSSIKTPFYYYDVGLLKKTVNEVVKESSRYNFHVHYAMKANSNPKLLEHIVKAGLGADCVSGNEVKRSVEVGFSPEKIVFAGVGKSDEEIQYALEKNIFCFNCESLQEMEVINEFGKRMNRRINIAIRINPHVDAHTHKYITTGLEENKFGISFHEFPEVVEKIESFQNLWLSGLHFHIGSQITELTPFRNLCRRVNELYNWYTQKGFVLDHINVGGGLGINYKEPEKNAIPDFASFFKTFDDFLEKKSRPAIHFELGRAIVGQCGSLISRVLYIKPGINTNFAILDAGMTELIRPALYQAYHKIENLSIINDPNFGVRNPQLRYDIVGPICESSDCFGKAVDLPETKRGDLMAIRSTGAYGEVMASCYNLRELVGAHFSE